MPTRTKPRRTTPRTVVQPRPTLVKSELPEQIAAQIKDRHEAQRRGQYQVFGNVSLIETETKGKKGKMRFPGKSGPAIAWPTLRNGNNETEVDRTKLLLISAWEGLPPLREQSTKPCQACMGTCDLCGEDGKKLCEGYQCGGRGWVPGPSQICAADGCLEKTGVYNPECKQCGGRGGTIPHQTCPMCFGSGKMRCPVCHGDKKRPTGIKNGSTNWMDGVCPECKGSKFDGEEKPQNFEEHINAWLGPMPVLGPILALTVQSIPGERPVVRQFDISPDGNGDLMVMLLEHGSNATNAYLLGGVVKERSTA